MIEMTSQLDSKTSYSLNKIIGCETFGNSSLKESINYVCLFEKRAYILNTIIFVKFEDFHQIFYQDSCLRQISNLMLGLHLFKSAPIPILSFSMIHFIPSFLTELNKELSFNIKVAEDVYITKLVLKLKCACSVDQLMPSQHNTKILNADLLHKLTQRIDLVMSASQLSTFKKSKNTNTKNTKNTKKI